MTPGTLSPSPHTAFTLYGQIGDMVTPRERDGMTSVPGLCHTLSQSLLPSPHIICAGK